jgi:hypothetical protein
MGTISGLTPTSELQIDEVGLSRSGTMNLRRLAAARIGITLASLAGVGARVELMN